MDAGVNSSTAQETRTILLVDDADSLGYFLEKLLVFEGYKVIYASNRKKAVELYKNNKHTINLILMDIARPIRNDLEAHGIMTHYGQNVSVLCMSIYSQESLRVIEHLHFIRKPMHPRDLLRSIKEIFDSSLPAPIPAHEVLNAGQKADVPCGHT